MDKIKFKIWHFAAFNILVLLISIPSMTLTHWIIGFCISFVSYWSIDLGWHRLWSHKTFEAKRWLEYVFMIFGSVGLLSALEFTATHRYHHKHSDTPKDMTGPHYNSIKNVLTQNAGDYQASKIELLKLIPDHLNDPLFKFFHKYIFLMLIAVTVLIGFVDYTWIPVIIGLGSIKIYLLYVASAGVLQHIVGVRIHTDQSRNSKILSYLSLGYITGHSTHHKYPQKYNYDFENDNFDLGKYLLIGMKKLGWIKL